jgi:hypothetical protein
MTSISAASSSSYLSPLQQLQKELQSEVSAGKISSSDQDALSSALTDIDTALQSSRASDASSGTRPSPDDLKSKIDDLIAGEVSSGKLTSDQAAELQDVFKSAFANGPGGAPGHPDGPPPDSDASSTAGSSDSSDSVADILQQFLKSLQESLSSASSTSYSANGIASSAGTSGSFSALLINYQT